MHRKHPLLPTVQGWNRAGLVEVVELGALSPEGVGGMVRAIFDQEHVTDEFRDFLFSRCEGNPFVLEEMLKLAMDRGDIYRGPNGWERKDLQELRLPRTVKDTLLLSQESNMRVLLWLTERAMATESVGLSLKGIEGETKALRLHAPAEVAPA